MKGKWLEASAFYLLKKHYRSRNPELARTYRKQYQSLMDHLVYEMDYQPFILQPDCVGIRFFYAGEAGESLQIFVNGVEVVGSLPNHTATQYVQMTAGDNYLTFVTNKGVRYSKLVSIHQNQLCTLVLLSLGEEKGRILLFRDEWMNKEKGPWVRFLHLATDLPALEWVNLKGEITLSAIDYSNVSKYQRFQPENQQGGMIRIAGSHQVVESLAPFMLHPNQVVTVIAIGSKRAGTFRLLLFLDR
ncbi:DUF4397 domain-containing protein [Risungbinella massiliensis]|uniref:DUF4397 domain-containing protein n=1 Tax=Risungbinella massiliensis TaxID=1329796 RepID=UPI0005CBFE05|nr:DUF4397 domain-containing protein [Risungbinella massiliensis]